MIPPGLVDAIGKLTEFKTSCAPVFVQRSGLAALADASNTVGPLVHRLRTCRDLLLPQLAAIPSVSVHPPPGGR